jgi:tRNA(fMet)-specific endonuclease VapC
MYLLDTDHVSILQRCSEPELSRLVGRLQSTPRSAVFVSIISFHEGFSGWLAFLNKAKTPADLVLAYRRMSQLLKDFSGRYVADFDDAAAHKAVELRATGIRIATMDLRIASIALTKNWTVVTRNFVDFTKVPNLRIEDWTI